MFNKQNTPENIPPTLIDKERGADSSIRAYPFQDLQNQFHAAMLTTYEEGVKRGYYLTYFL